MKKLTALILAVLMLVLCTACGSSEYSDEATIIASYSVKSADGDFIVEVQDFSGVYEELYDPNGIYIKFKGSKDRIYDSEGNELTRDDLLIGDTLEIHYSGKLASENPKTIKAAKVVKVS